jgi:hypothetical protein
MNLLKSNSQLFFLFSQQSYENLMKQFSITAKIFAVLSLISGSIWIGSYISRMFLVYQLFEGPELILRSYVNDGNIDGILISLLPAFVTHNTAFVVMVISILSFYFFSKVSLRNNGWLFIILIATIITTPFEIYLMLFDYKIINALMSNSFESGYIIGLLRDRIKELSSFSLVAIFTYLSFFFFIIFQPLTKQIEAKK